MNQKNYFTTNTQTNQDNNNNKIKYNVELMPQSPLSNSDHDVSIQQSTKRQLLSNSAPFMQKSKPKAGVIFSQAIINENIKPIILNFLKKIPSRMFKALSLNQYNLISDQSSQYQIPEHFEIQKQKIVPLNFFKSIFPIKQASQTDEDYEIVQLQSEQTRQKIIQYISNFRIIKCLSNLLDKIPVFNPSSKYKLIWDCIQLFVTILFIFFIPIHIVYDLHFQVLMGRFLSGLGPLLLIANNVFYLNMGIYDKGVLISNRINILQYWYRELLIQDLISVFPISIYVYINILDDNEKVESGFNIIKYSLLLIIFKMDRIIQTIKKSQERFIEKVKVSNIIGLIKLLGFALIMGHLFAILFLQVGLDEAQKGRVSWIVKLKLEQESWDLQYIYSYYFAAVTMMTIGYGDITPQTRNEIILTIFLMLASSGIFGYTLNCINQIFESFFKQESQKQQKLILLNNYMKKKKISTDLQYQIREYLDYVWDECSEDVEDEKLLESQLSETLKERLRLEANKLILKDSPIFKNNFSEQVIFKTVALIREVKCSPEEIIFLKDDIEIDNSIYFIDKGSADIFIDLKHKGGKSKGVQIIKSIHQGQCFGVINFFTGQPRVYNIRSAEFTNLLIIKRNDFLNLLSEYPDDYERFCHIKDNIIFNQRTKIDDQFHCGECSIRPKHPFIDCPMMHYIPNKKMIIKHQQNYQTQERNNFTVRRLTKYQTKANVINVTECLKQFHKMYEKILDQYENINKLEFDNDLTDESDSELSDNQSANELNQENETILGEKIEEKKQILVANDYYNDEHEQKKNAYPLQQLPQKQGRNSLKKYSAKIQPQQNNHNSISTTTNSKNSNYKSNIYNYVISEQPEELNCYSEEFITDNKNNNVILLEPDLDIFQLDFEQDQLPQIVVHTYEDWERELQISQQMQQLEKQQTDSIANYFDSIQQAQLDNIEQNNQTFTIKKEVKEDVKNLIKNNGQQRLKSSASNILDYKNNDQESYEINTPKNQQQQDQPNNNKNNILQKEQGEQQNNDNQTRSSTRSLSNLQFIGVNDNNNPQIQRRSVRQSFRQLSHKLDQEKQKSTNPNQDLNNLQNKLTKEQQIRLSQAVQVSQKKDFDQTVDIIKNDIINIRKTPSILKRKSTIMVDMPFSSNLANTVNTVNNANTNTNALQQQIQVLEKKLFAASQQQLIYSNNNNNTQSFELNNKGSLFQIQLDFELLTFDQMKNFMIYFPHNNVNNVLLQIKNDGKKKSKGKIEKKKKNIQYKNYHIKRTTFVDKNKIPNKYEALFKRKYLHPDNINNDEINNGSLKKILLRPRSKSDIKTN